jgi:magnesium chelatase accessory protein
MQAPSLQARWESEKATWPLREFSRFVQTRGLRWHVQCAGRGPHLLLVHGTGASTHSWRDLIPRLAERFTVVAADLPGHGFTEAVSAEQRSIEGMSACLAELLRTLDCQPMYCVGHSAGAVILCRMVLDGFIQPRVIVSVNGAFLPLASTVGRLFSPLAKLLVASPWLPRLLAWQGGSTPSVARVLAGTGSQLTPQGIEFYRRLVRNPDHIAGALGMMGSWDLDTFQPALNRLAIPLVLIVGENDKTVPPAQALELQRRMRHARVVVLPRLGHLAHEEAPDLVVDQIIGCCDDMPIKDRIASPACVSGTPA